MSFQVLSLWLYGVSDPVLIQEVYTQLQKFQTRGKNGIAYFIPNSLLGLENCDQLWKQHRNIIVGAFTESYLRKYSNEIISVGKQLEANLMKDGLVKNINDLMGEVAYQVLANTVMGKDWLSVFPNAGSKEERDAALFTANLLTPFPEALWHWVPSRSRTIADRAAKPIRDHATKMITEIREKKKQGDSMLHFLALHEENLPINEIIDELLSLTMAGHETTANTLSFAFVALALNPVCQETARAEIRSLESEGIEVTYKMINRLQYCWAIFRETLRIFPTVPVNARHVEEDCQLGGYFLPKGTRVIINHIGVCRSSKYFQDPLKFLPERWGKDEKQLRNYDVTRNFGGGLRICIGKRFAEEESILLLALILSKFRITLHAINGKLVENSDAVVLTDIPTDSNVTMTFEHPISLKFIPI